MQVVGQTNNDENRPKLSSQIETEVVDQVAGLCCCAALLLGMTTTMTRSGKTIEQMQETRERHSTPDVARGLEASLPAPALLSQRRSVFRSFGAQLTSSTAAPPRRRRCPSGDHWCPGTVRKTQKKKKNSHYGCAGIRSWCAVHDTFVLTLVH